MALQNLHSQKIWEDRYRKDDESYEQNLKRVAKYCAQNEKEAEMFFKVMDKKWFFPAGRIMCNAGRGQDLTLNNCFTAPPVEDSMTDIFNKVALGGITHQKGGGIGYDFSNIRPKGQKTSNDAVASGPISFMHVFNAATHTILQGNRRGANMGIMSVYSLSIEDFINAKSYDQKDLEHFNLSVMVDDDFMKAVSINGDIFLHHPVYDNKGKIIKDPNQWKISEKRKAKDIWDLIVKKSYDNGEPGVLFYDNMNKDNNLGYIEQILVTNPCSEYLSGMVYGTNPVDGTELNPTDFGGACNLGSLYIHNFVDNPFTSEASINYANLFHAIKVAVRLLDNIIDINNYPDKIYENYQKSFRTIGLGVTGLADAMTMLNITYGSEKSLTFTDILMDTISSEVYMTSIELAKEKGSFPFLDKEKYVNSNYFHKKISSGDSDDSLKWSHIVKEIKEHGIRNGKLLSVAPTGTTSLVFGENCSSGLEPIYQLESKRKVRMGGQNEEHAQIVDLRDYAYEKWLDFKKNFSSKCIVHKDVFVTAEELPVEDHINVLEKVAYHVDMSCSKTINLPTEYTFEETKNVFETIWKKGIKGCTIFRPNDLRMGIFLKEEKTYPRGYIKEPDTLNSIGKYRKLTSDKGSLFVSVFFNKFTGEMTSIFLSTGSKGEDHNYMIGLSRLISIAARGGISTYDIIDQLLSSSVYHNDKEKFDISPVAIGHALLEMTKEVEEEIKLLKLGTEMQMVSAKKKTSDKETKEIVPPSIRSICPNCGSELVNEGGCNVCKECGWGKCGL